MIQKGKRRRPWALIVALFGVGILCAYGRYQFDRHVAAPPQMEAVPRIPMPGPKSMPDLQTAPLTPTATPTMKPPVSNATPAPQSGEKLEVVPDEPDDFDEDPAPEPDRPPKVMPASLPQVEQAPVAQVPAEVPAEVVQMPVSLNKHMLACLAQAIYGEARGEPLKAKYRVGWSVRFRAEENRPDFGGWDICDVVFKRDWVRGKDGSVHLRWQYDGAHIRVVDQNAWKEAVYIAYQVLMGEEKPLVPAEYFCAPYACGWHRHKMFVEKSGHQLFFAERH